MAIDLMKTREGTQIYIHYSRQCPIGFCYYGQVGLQSVQHKICNNIYSNKTE